MAEHHEHVRCEEVVELVTDYLERALDHDDAALFEQHLNFCDGCVAYVEQMRVTIRAAAMTRGEGVSDETRATLLAAFRGWRDA